MITQEELKARLKYDPETGLFIRVLNTCRFKQGTIAGSTSHPQDYVFIKIKNKTYAAHRLAWLYMTGEFPPYPEFEIDHINRVRDDNRWENLRLSTNTASLS